MSTNSKSLIPEIPKFQVILSSTERVPETLEVNLRLTLYPQDIIRMNPKGLSFEKYLACIEFSKDPSGELEIRLRRLKNNLGLMDLKLSES